MELIQAIALLCLTAGADNPRMLGMQTRAQARCHAYYAKCLNHRAIKGYQSQILKCIQERKP